MSNSTGHNLAKALRKGKPVSTETLVGYLGSVRPILDRKQPQDEKALINTLEHVLEIQNATRLDMNVTIEDIYCAKGDCLDNTPEVALRKLFGKERY